MDPDTEIITDTAVTPGNAGDASVAEDLISDLLEGAPETVADDVGDDATADPTEEQAASPEGGEGDGGRGPDRIRGQCVWHRGLPLPSRRRGIESKCKTQKPNATRRDGLFSKERFTVDLDDDTAICPAGATVSIGRHRDGGGMAKFAGGLGETLGVLTRELLAARLSEQAHHQYVVDDEVGGKRAVALLTLGGCLHRLVDRRGREGCSEHSERNPVTQVLSALSPRLSGPSFGAEQNYTSVTLQLPTSSVGPKGSHFPHAEVARHGMID